MVFYSSPAPDSVDDFLAVGIGESLVLDLYVDFSGTEEDVVCDPLDCFDVVLPVEECEATVDRGEQSMEHQVAATAHA